MTNETIKTTKEFRVVSNAIRGRPSGPSFCDSATTQQTKHGVSVGGKLANDNSLTHVEVGVGLTVAVVVVAIGSLILLEFAQTLVETFHLLATVHVLYLCCHWATKGVVIRYDSSPARVQRLPRTKQAIANSAKVKNRLERQKKNEQENRSVDGKSLKTRPQTYCGLDRSAPIDFNCTRFCVSARRTRQQHKQKKTKLSTHKNAVRPQNEAQHALARKLAPPIRPASTARPWTLFSFYFLKQKIYDPETIGSTVGIGGTTDPTNVHDCRQTRSKQTKTKQYTDSCRIMANMLLNDD